MGKVKLVIRVDEAIIRRYEEIGVDISEAAEAALKTRIETMQGKSIPITA